MGNRVLAFCAAIAGWLLVQQNATNVYALAPFAPSGPVAIASANSGKAVVLQANSEVFEFDMNAGQVGRRLYQVPSGFWASDVGYMNGIIFLALNRGGTGGQRGFLMMLTPDRPEGKQQVWRQMPHPGYAAGVALDQSTGIAYVTNASLNVVYKVPPNGEAEEFVILPRAERIGAIALDGVGRRIFVDDSDRESVHIVSLDSIGVRTMRLGDIEFVRALAWSLLDRRLYVADAGREGVWFVEPDSPQPKLRTVSTDKRIKNPSGLALAPDGSIWMADEDVPALFRIAPTTRAVLSFVKWAPASR